MTRALRTWLVACAALLALAAGAHAATPRASFNDIEDELMCISCNVPLNIANSPQADDERAEVKRLIALGLTKQQIKDRLVADLGRQILADPPTSGFDVTTWLVPVGAIGGVAVLLVLTLPRWRRREAAAHAGPADDGPALSPADLRRLDEDLAATER